MKQVLELKIQVIRTAALFSLVIIVTTFVLGYREFSFGFFYGTILALLNWLLLSKTVEKSVNYEPRKAQVYSVLHYIIRLGIIGLAVYIAAMREDMHILGTILALFLPKGAIFWHYVVIDNFNYFMRNRKR